MLNSSLRTLEAAVIMKMTFFICDLHRQIESLYKQQISLNHGKTFQVFRGQGLSRIDFDKLQKNKGGLISFNNFLSTSKDRDVSLGFANGSSGKPGCVAILFQMSIDYVVSSAPFAFIREVSCFGEEDEILFSMHTVFRIDNIQKIDIDSPLYQVDLKLTSDDDEQLRQLTESIRQESSGPTSWTRLGKLLLQIGQFSKAEELYTTLLEQTTDDTTRALLYHQLGVMKYHQNDCKEAALFYEKSLEIKRKTLPQDHPSLASTYSNIGTLYDKMSNYTKALEFYEKTLKIDEQTLSSNQPELAISYNNVGSAYENMGDYSKALEFYEKAIKIEETSLPLNHPSLAISYACIAKVYNSMGDYSKALEFYEKGHKIFEKSLPSNHPHLAISTHEIGLVYERKGEYFKASQFYEQTVEIAHQSLPANHLHLKLYIERLQNVKKKL